MILYETFVENLNNPYIGEYTAYGIVAYQAVELQKKEIFKMSDVSTGAKIIMFLAQLCNKEQLDPIHFIDVVEDMLYS